MTLRVRFAVWVSLLLLAVLGAFGSFVYLDVANWLSASVDDSLRLSATQVIETIDIEDGRIDLSDNPVTQDSSLADELRARGLTIQILETDGSSIKSFGPYRDLTVDPSTLAAALAGRSTLVTRTDPSGGGAIRVLTQAITNDGHAIGVVQISESLRNVEDSLRGLLTALLLGSPILVLAAGVGGYLLAGRALAPIDHITQTAHRISAEDLSGRLDLPESHDEVGRLAATFDEMLARLDGAFRRERQFTTDAAQELRTPLTAMQAILSVTAQRQRTAAEYETALADLAEETAQLSALTEDLLRLARAEHPPVTVEPIDLSTLLSDVADSMRPLAQTKYLALTCTVQSGLSMSGDTDSLIRLCLNLIDNGIKYTAQGGIGVSASEVGNDLQIVVADTGRGISPEQLPHVFERFYRADEARTAPGTGLGLVISWEIVKAHGGSISAESTPGVGSKFTVNLPRKL